MLIVGAIVAVVVVGVAAVLAVALFGGAGSDSAGNPAPLPFAAPPKSITYEITGTSKTPLDVVYTGSGGEDIEKTVSSLPWSVTVYPPPDVVSIFALPTSVEDPDPHITLALKSGREVLRRCTGGVPCLRPYPAS